MSYETVYINCVFYYNIITVFSPEGIIFSKCIHIYIHIYIFFHITRNYFFTKCLFSNLPN